MYIRPSQLHRIVIASSLALVSLWGSTMLWLQAFYQLAPKSITICAKDKQARTLLDSAEYTLIFCEGNEVKSINTSRSEYLTLKEGDAVCYSYNSILNWKFNFQLQRCWQDDNYSFLFKLLDLFEDI